MAKTSKRRYSRNGFTLVELVVAMVISGIVITMALVSWAFISRHTTLTRRTSEFRAQAEQASFIVVNGVRTSEKVLSFDRSAITFVAAKSGDTVSYSFANDSLRKNGTPVRFVQDNVAVVKFLVEKNEAASAPSAGQLAAPDEPRDMVLTITLGVRDRAGALSEIPSEVKVRFAPARDPYGTRGFSF
jgi:prepilin-type N-terminal cleavage/methylation domain-containing protein